MQEEEVNQLGTKFTKLKVTLLEHTIKFAKLFKN